MKDSVNADYLKKTTKPLPVVVAKGDGIGPEIMDATLKILEAANVTLDADHIEIGEQAYLSGNTSGIPESAWEAIHKKESNSKSPYHYTTGLRI